MNVRLALLSAAAALLPLTASAAFAQTRTTPLADHHQHVISPAAARGAYPLPLPEIAVPNAVKRLLADREKAWNDPKKLAAIYAPNAIMLNGGDEDLPSWLTGRKAASDHIGRIFGRRHRIRPVMFQANGSSAVLAGYFYRADTDRHFGQVLLSLARQADGSWRIAAEAPVFPGPPATTPIDAAGLIEQLDQAGIARAAVLSVAYWYGSSFRSTDDSPEAASVRRENDWAASEASRHPGRLFAFCSFNPLKPYALEELDYCATSRRFTGIKLHFGNSEVDLRKPEHAARLAALFAEANRRRMPLIVHLWTDPSFEKDGGDHVRIFLDKLLAQAPDIPVQVAHMAGGGRSTAPAMEEFVKAFQARDPRVARVYFDLATAVTGQTNEGLKRDVEYMRAIGLGRFLFGTDSSPPNPAAGRSWAAMYALPLTDSEFRTIAANTAPYFPR